jgi:transcription elongation factor S-II
VPVHTCAESEGVAGDPDGVGAQVEAELFAKFLPSKGSADHGAYQESGGGSSKDYKVKFRQLSFNLKDANNPDLRRSVLLGEVTPEELLALSSEELGSSARREENLKIRERAMWECERGQATQASTDAFQCGKCKQRKTTYFQMQTRSADEPMTTFVTCVFPGCNNRWKFC